MKNLTRMAICIALTAVCSQIIIQLPFSPVPFTGSVIGVFLTGALLKPKYAFASQSAYLLMGSIGLPIFAGFGAGFGVLLGPTGGYAMAYPIMALLISYLSEKILYEKKPNLISRKSRFLYSVFIMILAMVVCYVLGSLWLSHVAGISVHSAFLTGVIPFIAFDFIKILIAVYIGSRTSPFLRFG